MLATVAFSAAARAHADEAPPWLLFKAPVPRDAARWREQIARTVGPLAATQPSARFAGEAPALAAPRLALLLRIEELLASARAQTAALAEDRALSDLAEAARIGEQLGDIPGAAEWNAEIQLNLGVTAAQAGLDALAEDAFRAAATLDRSRRLLEAEAPPAVVQQYERVAREVALAPPGQLEVTAAAPGARVYLDDTLQGAVPARVRTSVGRHVLRVEAPGHLVYGAFIDVLEGQRPPLSVRLAPQPALEQAQELERAASRGDYRMLARALRDLAQATARPASALVLETGQERHKALLFRCQAAAFCARPLRIRGLDSGQLLPPWPQIPLDATSLAAERAWLIQPPRALDDVLASPTPWWRRWYVWGSVLAAAAGTALAFGLSADRHAPERLRVVIEPGDVGQ